MFSISGAPPSLLGDKSVSAKVSVWDFGVVAVDGGVTVFVVCMGGPFCVFEGTAVTFRSLRDST